MPDKEDEQAHSKRQTVDVRPVANGWVVTVGDRYNHTGDTETYVAETPEVLWKLIQRLSVKPPP